MSNAAQTISKAVSRANATMKNDDAGTTNEVSASLLSGTANTANANNHQKAAEVREFQNGVVMSPLTV